MEQVAPENVRFSSERLKRLDAVIQRYIDEGRVPGVLMLVARHGKLAYCNSFGMMDIEAQRPTQPDTIYRIYSMSKLVTSVAIMMLHEENRFFLDEPISEFIPEFKDVRVYAAGGNTVAAERPMTFRHLLTHTSGLVYDTPNSPVERLYQEADLRNRDVPLRDWIKKLAAQPLLHQPGTEWHYSMSTDVLGYLVEAISGMPFDEFLTKRIFEPLGMVDTAFYVPADKVNRLATLYGAGLWAVSNEQVGDYTQRPAWSSGGGGLVGTGMDYLRFCQMMLNGGELDGERLLGPRTVAYMATNHLSEEVRAYKRTPAPGPGYGFGLGVNVLLDPIAAGRPGSVGEYGWSGAAYTHYWIDPVEDLTVVKMTQIMYRDQDGNEVERRDMNADLRIAVYQALVD
jgi:CubicO group peptidase (beta-lactamase class C family)